MTRRIPVMVLLGLLLLVTAACTNKKVKNPLADLNSKQPDKVLFDRSLDAMKHNRFDVARMTLQTLINTYPDSEYIARAKLAVADSWYAEGGTTALAQAEIEFRDFITFFPNMPEAAEAQYKVANIHYQQMEKPDRDFTHAARAEDEYRQLMLQFPDSKLVPEAKVRLLEVQEVLAEREFRVGRFYYLRQSWPASIARLRSVSDRYPLYSGADEALFLLGQAYEGAILNLRERKLDETTKARLIKQYAENAGEAYSKILTRYPVMVRAGDAKAQLQALHLPVPQATPEAIAQNKKEQESRGETGMVSHVMGNFRRRPDMEQAAKVGEPTMVDPQPVSATEVIQAASRVLTAGSGSGSNTVSVETVKDGTPPPNEAAPRSDSSAATGAPPTGATEAASPYSELKPNAPAEAQPGAPAGGGQALPPPQQVNEIPASGNATSSNQAPDAAADASPAKNADPNAVSSSKSKKKKGLKKIIPF
jgi:outer membrane protein assembly factor BamD